VSSKRGQHLPFCQLSLLRSQHFPEALFWSPKSPQGGSKRLIFITSICPRLNLNLHAKSTSIWRSINDATVPTFLMPLRGAVSQGPSLVHSHSSDGLHALRWLTCQHLFINGAHSFGVVPPLAVLPHRFQSQPHQGERVGVSALRITIAGADRHTHKHRESKTSLLSMAAVLAQDAAISPRILFTEPL